MRFKPQKIVIEKTVADEPLTGEILAGFKGLPVEFVDKPPINGAAADPSMLVVARQKGRFVKKCPGTPVYQCCAYYILNLGIGCTFNCHYCYLHHYMNTPFIIYANLDDLLVEVREFSAARPEKISRLGSGEFIDSVGLDEIVDVNRVLIPALGRIDNVVFEIKTKSRNVKHLLELDHGGRVVVSWSVNSAAVTELEEPDADSLTERLGAAAVCRKAGYKIGWHFDPLIHYSGWESDYKRVIDLIFDRLEAADIAWISLGALRFNPALKPIIKRKFPGSRLLFGELVPGLDGKLRYFRPIRQEMFRRLIEHIRGYSREVPVYLCMENQDMALEVGAQPGFAIAQSKAFG
jgi:spore photoproduct lyase